MTTVGWLPAPVEDLFGTDATAEESYEVLTVDVPPTSWTVALRTARDDLGCTYFDWLSAVDEPGTGFRVSAHVVALTPVRRLLLRTTIPHESPVLASAVDVYAGAAWHERETHEMFGVVFEGHPALDHLLLPEAFEGHPLRKDFVLAARVAKAWPGAKEPGESDHGGPKRRQMLPPGVPDPNEWGPLKGQLPPAPARPARGAGRAAGERPVRAAGERPERPAGERPVRAAGERPARRTRTAAEGSASQTPASTETTETTETTAAVGDAAGKESPAASGAPTAPQAPARPRRARSASEGSASQRAESPEAPASPAAAPRSSDAPWHHARPAFDEPEPKSVEPKSAEPEPEAPEPDAHAEAGAVPPTGQAADQGADQRADQAAEGPHPDGDSAPDGPSPGNPTPDNPTGGPR